MTQTVNPCRIIDSRERDSRKNRVAGGETSVRLKETKDAELVRSSVPIAGENDGYVDAQPEIEDCLMSEAGLRSPLPEPDLHLSVHPARHQYSMKQLTFSFSHG